MDSELKHATCPCGTEFDYQPMMHDGREMFPRKFCSQCMASFEKEADERDKETTQASD